MKFTPGKGAGLVGGILTLVGLFLPWATVEEPVTGTAITLNGLFPVGFLVLIFGILGLIFVLIEKRGFAIATLIFGILGLLFTLFNWFIWSAVVAIATLGGFPASIGYGVWISLVGTIILIVGGALAMGETKKMMMAPPMMPPPMQAPPPGM